MRQALDDITTAIGSDLPTYCSELDCNPSSVGDRLRRYAEETQ